MSTPNDIEKAKINLETAKIPWTELQRFFAAGKVLWVSPELDITNVALDISADAVDKVHQLIDENLVQWVSDKQALEWYESEALVWSVVVKPYVLVQKSGREAVKS